MTHPLFRIDASILSDVARALAYEWLETDGIGGYAASTSLLCPTRRYHGLLVSPPPGSDKRHVFLARMEETARYGGVEEALSLARYPGAFSAGKTTIESFELCPHPRAAYRVGGTSIVREIQMVRGEPTVLIQYSRPLDGTPGEVELELRPLLAFREADALTFENAGLDPTIDSNESGFSTHPYATLPPLQTSASKPLSVEPSPVWYRRIEYALDLRRGYPCHEDQVSPAVLRTHLAAGERIVIAATIGERVLDPALAWKRAAARRERDLPDEPSALDRARIAAEDFLYRTASGRLGVVAGFPWFGEWGRDTFIAAPGLTLARGKLGQLEEILHGALEFLKDGLMPNVFGQTRESSDYGSADAALWFARAVHLFQEAGGRKVREHFLDPLLEIATAYRDGTGLCIEADEHGLLAAGGESLNATWMDARTSEGPVTPRAGCAVEINALWYSLLCQLEEMLGKAGRGKRRKEWAQMRKLVKRSFLERFWIEEEGTLADVWDQGRIDKSVRPNMVIAAALEHSPLTRAQRASVVERAERELLVPMGLRSLSPLSKDYCGRYQGDPAQRDRAYHQGTVWPWLFGFYCEAALRSAPARKRERESTREQLRARWAELASEMDRSGLMHISEVFDGDAPHEPGGTFAQAWNTGELLRSWTLIEQDSL